MSSEIILNPLHAGYFCMSFLSSAVDFFFKNNFFNNKTNTLEIPTAFQANRLSLTFCMIQSFSSDGTSCQIVNLTLKVPITTASDRQRGTCIKRLFWPPYEAKKTKIAFHKFLFISLLEQ